MGKTQDFHNLQEHLRTDTGQKHCEYKECGKTFRYHSSLKVDARMHTGENTTMRSVGKPSVVTLTFEKMGDCTLGRNPMNVNNVGKISVIFHHCNDM